MDLQIPPMPQMELPPPKPSLSSFLIDEQALSEKEIEPTQWLFPSLLPSPALVGLVGRPGSYKTFFAHWIARRLSEGKSLFDHYDTDPGWSIAPYNKEVKTLIIEEEMGEEIVQERINSLKLHKQENIYWMLNSGFQLSDKERVEELKKIVIDKQIGLLVLDPFITISGLKDENDNAAASEMMKILLDNFINAGPRITVLFIHHPSKSSDGDVMRGAGDILGKSYMGFALEKIGESNEIKVKCIKSRWSWPKAFKMEMSKENDKLSFVYRGLLESENATKKDSLQDQIEYLLKKEQALTKVQIGRLLGRKTDPKKDVNLGKAMVEMIESGLIVYDEECYVYSLK